MNLHDAWMTMIPPYELLKGGMLRIGWHLCSHLVYTSYFMNWPVNSPGKGAQTLRNYLNHQDAGSSRSTLKSQYRSYSTCWAPGLSRLLRDIYVRNVQLPGNLIYQGQGGLPQLIFCLVHPFPPPFFLQHHSILSRPNEIQINWWYQTKRGQMFSCSNINQLCTDICVWMLENT